MLEIHLFQKGTARLYSEVLEWDRFRGRFYLPWFDKLKEDWILDLKKECGHGGSQSIFNSQLFILHSLNWNIKVVRGTSRENWYVEFHSTPPTVTS